MMARKKMNSKNSTRQKIKKRRLLSLSRVIKYGLENFLRNSWLSVAATAIMTITLAIVFVVFASRLILNDTIADLSNKVDMSIYLKTETTNEIGEQLIEKVKALESVKEATFISAEEARAKIAEENKDNPDVLEAIKEATNKNPATLRVVVVDINDTSELEAFVENDEIVKKNLNSDYAPSFAGERRETIKSIGRAVSFIQEIGVAIGAVFVVISSLIIFNTIRMAIFNRREEIQMMRLIGADKSFVRGPFLVEAIVYGFLAALVASGLGFLGLYKAAGTLNSYQISAEPTIDFMTKFAPIVVLVMMGVGAVIGIVSAALAIRKYLKP